MANGDVHTMYDPSSDDWYNKRVGASRASSRHETKAEASARGQDLARSTNSEWLGHKKENNAINERNTYGNDPRRSKG